MDKPFLWIVEHPGPSSLLLLLATVFFATQLPRLQIDTSAEIQMMKSDPDQAYYDETRRRFGDEELTVILVRAADVFTSPVLNAIKRISSAVALLDGVKRVDSLSTVDNIRGEGDWLEIGPVLDGTVPELAADLERARKDALGTPFFVNNLVAADSRAAAINIYLDPDATGERFNRYVTREIDKIIELEKPPGTEIFQTGPPLTKVTIVDYVTRDWSILIPTGLFILLCILFLVFREWHAVFIPISTCAVSIVWGLGMMASLGYAVNIVSSMIPSLLIIVGFTEDVHLVGEYERAIDEGQGRTTALRTMMRAMGLPILITSATTAIGFGSLSLSSVRMYAEFGQATALVLVSNFFVTVVMVPALLRYWPAFRSKRRHTPGSQWGTRFFLERRLAGLGPATLRWKTRILICTGAVFIVSLYGLQTVRLDAGLLSHFKADSNLLRRTQGLHEAMAGGLTFYVVVDTKHTDGVKRPALLKKLEGLQDFLSGTGMVDKTVSIADYIKKIHLEMNDGRPVVHPIPDSSELIAQYLLLLESPEVSQLLDHRNSAANVVVRHNIIGSLELLRLFEKLEDYIRSHFGDDVEVRFTGQDLLITNAAKQLAVAMVTGFSYTLVAVAIVNMLLFKSLTLGLLSLIPNVLPVFSYLGLLGFLDIPLNTGTAMIAPIAVGIAVDDTVHYMVRYRNELVRHGDRRGAMIATLTREGPAIITTSIGLSGGFLVMILSRFATNFYFGILAAFVMVVALLADLFLTPVLMHMTNPTHLLRR